MKKQRAHVRVFATHKTSLHVDVGIDFTDMTQPIEGDGIARVMSVTVTITHHGFPYYSDTINVLSDCYLGVLNAVRDAVAKSQLLGTVDIINKELVDRVLLHISKTEELEHAFMDVFDSEPCVTIH